MPSRVFKFILCLNYRKLVLRQKGPISLAAASPNASDNINVNKKKRTAAICVASQMCFRGSI
jgi:hypothetical protein